MPELPDVEILRRFFQRHVEGRTIDTVAARDPLVVARPVGAILQRELPGRSFGASRRHGKYLFSRAASGRAGAERVLWVVFHFGMTGSLAVVRRLHEEPRSTRLLVRFRDGSALAYVCPRRLGRVTVVERPEHLLAARRLGPDALDADLAGRGLERALSHYRSAIKALLLDQSAIAGVGNLYADEALFQAGIPPRAPACALTSRQWERLARCLARVLKGAIEREEESRPFPRKWLLPRRRERSPCPRCGAPLSRTIIGGRSTYFCPRHQRWRG